MSCGDERMYELYGTSPEQFGGAYPAWQQGLHPDDRARSTEEANEATAGTKPFDTEFRVVWVPEMDGLEATRRIREIEASESSRIIGLTANASPMDREACLSAGMNDFVSKPVDLSSPRRPMVQALDALER